MRLRLKPHTIEGGGLEFAPSDPTFCEDSEECKRLKLLAVHKKFVSLAEKRRFEYLERRKKDVSGRSR